MSELKDADPDVFNAVMGEEERERSKIVLIASEHYVGPAVLEARSGAGKRPGRPRPPPAEAARREHPAR